MSYIGRLPIKIPSNIDLELLKENRQVRIEGPNGSQITPTF